RSVPHVVIVEANDMSKLLASSHTRVFKLHGDFSNPDSLVFTTNQYDSYPRDEIISLLFKSSIAEGSIVFVGYSASDPNLRREWAWVKNHGLSRKLFLVSDQFDEYKRREFEDGGLRCIALGSFDLYPQFLRDLKLLVEEREGRGTPPSGLVSVGADPVDPSVAGALADMFERARRDLEAGRVRSAAAQLELLAPLVRNAASSGAPRDVEFAQRVILALANSLQWQGDRARALSLYR